MINTFIHTHSSLENHTRFQLDQKGQSVCPFLDQNGPKTIPFWGGTCLYDLYIHHYHRNIQSHCGNRAWSGKKVAHSQFLGPDYLRVWNRQALKRMTCINCHLTFCGISKNNFEFHVFVTSSPVDRDQLIILLTSCQFKRRALFLFCLFFPMWSTVTTRPVWQKSKVIYRLTPIPFRQSDSRILLSIRF